MLALPGFPAAQSVSERVRVPSTHAAGFSLVEVLVTLSITALASAMLVATARPADPLKTEGERLTRAIEQMQTQARISGTPMGMTLDARGYAIISWRDGAWSSVSTQRHSFARGVTVRWAKPSSQGAGDLAVLHPAPDIVIDPLGHSIIQPIVLESKEREFLVPTSPAPTGIAP